MMETDEPSTEPKASNSSASATTRPNTSNSIKYDQSCQSVGASAQGSTLTEEKMMSLDEVKDFVNKGRTGRRNAVADFNLDPNLNTISASMLADMMCKSGLDCHSNPDQASNHQINN